MNNVTILSLEFIRTTVSLRGRAKSPRPRRQVKKARRRSYRYVENVFGRQRRHRALQPTAVEGVVWIHSFMQNKPKVKSAKFNANSFVTSKYVLIGHLVIQTTKPIQSQLKPILSQFAEREKLMQSYHIQRLMKKNPAICQKKQTQLTQLKPIFTLSRILCFLMWQNQFRRLPISKDYDRLDNNLHN